jgi:hypothetical protein
MVMIIDVPVASYFPPEEIREWIVQLEHARKDPDAEPSDVRVIDRYIDMAREWLNREREGESAA